MQFCGKTSVKKRTILYKKVSYLLILFFLISGSARVPALESRGAPVSWDGGRPPDWRDQGGGGETTPNGVGYEMNGNGEGGGERYNSQEPQKDQPKKAARNFIHI